MDRDTSGTAVMPAPDTSEGQSLREVPSGRGPGGLVVRPATTASELDAYARVWSLARPEAPISGDEVRRRLADRDDGRRYLLAEAGDEVVGVGFASRTSTPGRGTALVAVPQTQRRRGIGSVLLDAALERTRELGASTVTGSLRREHLPCAERRGFRVYDREVELVLELGAAPPRREPPEGIRIAELADEHLAGAYALYAEGVADIPSLEPLSTSSERWRVEAAAAPLVLVALDGDRVVGYAQLGRNTGDVLGHELTAVARTHRRRGIARALKQAQIAWATERGYRRLMTDTHWANEATRRLNESLGYRPLPPLLLVRRELT